MDAKRCDLLEIRFFLRINFKHSDVHQMLDYCPDFVENHWSNEDKAMELVKHCLIPYKKKVQEELGLRSTRAWFLIADIFKGQ